MNMLHKKCVKQFFRFAGTAAGSSKFIAEPLKKRALIRVHGKEVVPFLQGLITNDMYHLYTDGNPSMFAMFLNNAGRVLYDSIIYKTPGEDTFIIECDRQISSELRRHLRLYRVRRKIDIDCINAEYTPWVVYNPDENGEVPRASQQEVNIKSTEVLCTPDPRVKELGVRVIQPHSNQLKDIAKLFSDATVEQSALPGYSSHRYSYGVGEGINDHPPGKCFPLEANCDFLHGVSFQKGCYVGQELTARVYHTGVVRKRLLPLKLSTNLEANVTNVQTKAGAVVGTIRGASQKRALALLRVDPVLKGQQLMIDGDSCKVFKPHWWPKELPTRQSLRTE